MSADSCSLPGRGAAIKRRARRATLSSPLAIDLAFPGPSAWPGKSAAMLHTEPRTYDPSKAYSWKMGISGEEMGGAGRICRPLHDIQGIIRETSAYMRCSLTLCGLLTLGPSRLGSLQAKNRRCHCIVKRTVKGASFSHCFVCKILFSVYSRLFHLIPKQASIVMSCGSVMETVAWDILKLWESVYSLLLSCS